MPVFALLFGLGVVGFQQLPEIPPAPVLALLLAAVPALAMSPARRLLPLLLGLAWSHAHALLSVPPSLAAAEARLEVRLEGTVVGLPATARGRTRFLIRTGRIGMPDGPVTRPHLFRLSWQDAPAIRPGERWRIAVRLKPAHGYASPGAWDYEGWLYHQGVRYTGYVLADDGNRRLGVAGCCWIDRIRHRLGAALDGLPVSAFAVAVMRALVVADRSAMDPADKALFILSGTSHLMAVSGLHIGLIAGFAALLTGTLWRRCGHCCLASPARAAGIVAGLLAATGYALLAGLQLPTQRALIMLFVFALVYLSGRDADPLRVLSVAFLLVLAWHPPSVLSAGLWLSFGAVLAIIAISAWVQRGSWLRQAIYLQLGISLALWPLLDAFGLPVSPLAPLVNLLLVPVFGILIVPGCLLGASTLVLQPELGRLGLTYLALALDGIRVALQWMSSLAIPLPDPVNAWLIVLAVALILLPAGLPMRGLSVALVLTASLPRAAQIDPGAFRLDLLDVGQGLSAVVQTRHHVLVFDTGPRYPGGFSTAGAVVLPFLRAQGRRRIDRLVLSHGDNDHAGGAARLQDEVAVARVDSGEPARVDGGAERCIAGEHWTWDGVHFEYLAPAAKSRFRGNNASCVLRVGNRAGVLLATGDIERRAERRLLETQRQRLRSRVVIAPHHGSASSSGSDFVSATRPDYVLFAAGWANRWRFPAADVVARWRESGAIGINTAHAGTIGLMFGAAGVLSEPSLFRRDERRYWMHRGGSADAPHAVSFVD